MSGRIEAFERKIRGHLAYPGFSLNNKLYSPKQLEYADGRRLQIFDQHGDMFELDPITHEPLMEINERGQKVPRLRRGPSPPPDGYMDVVYNRSTRMLDYTGEITNEWLSNEIDAGRRKFVSLRSQPKGYEIVKLREDPDEFYAPYGSEYISAATTDRPGIPVATLNAEMFVSCEFYVEDSIGTGTAGAAKGVLDQTDQSRMKPDAPPPPLATEINAVDSSPLACYDCGSIFRTLEQVKSHICRLPVGSRPQKREIRVLATNPYDPNTGQERTTATGRRQSPAEIIVAPDSKSGITAGTASSPSATSEMGEAKATLQASQSANHESGTMSTTENNNQKKEDKEINNTDTGKFGGKTEVMGRTSNNSNARSQDGITDWDGNPGASGTDNQATGNNALGDGTPRGSRSTQGSVSDGGIPQTVNRADLEAYIAKLLASKPEILEAVLAKHPTLVALERLAAQFTPHNQTARTSGNITATLLSPIEASIWDDVTRIGQAIRESKAARRDNTFSIETGILAPPELEFANAMERMDYFKNIRKLGRAISGTAKPPPAYEASLTSTTSGAALGVDSATPVVVIPTQYPAQLRDTTLFGVVPQGADRKRFQLINAYSMGALTESTEPTQLTDTLTQVDVLTTTRGGEKAISFEAQRKVIGPIDEGVILAMRLGELYDEDKIIYGGLGVSGISGLSDIATGNLANVQYGDGTVSADNTITSTMTMKASYISAAVKFIINKGFSPDNLVAVLAPKQFDDLLNDSNIVRYVQWWYGTDVGNALMSQGFIPQLFGVEIRRSTLAPTVVTTSSGTGYQAYIYKKQFSIAMAASQDVLIESFRDIRKNETVYKISYMLGTNVISAASVARIDTS